MFTLIGRIPSNNISKEGVTTCLLNTKKKPVETTPTTPQTSKCTKAEITKRTASYEMFYALVLRTKLA